MSRLSSLSDQRRTLLALFHAGVSSVNGRSRVYASLQDQQEDFYLVSVGKCAVSMARGAYDACPDKIISSFIVTKDEVADPLFFSDANIHLHVSSHPIPDMRSLQAGHELLRYIAGVPETARLLFLISGGTSSLVEVLPDGVSLQDVQRANNWLLSNNYSIHEINSVRRRFSLIKGGGLLNYLGHRKSRVKFISDVPGDLVSSIGSGWFFPQEKLDFAPEAFPDWLAQLLAKVKTPTPLAEAGEAVTSEIIACNADARLAIVHAAKPLGLKVYQNDSEVTGEVKEVADHIAQQLLDGPAGLYVWGGETTVDLPESPGRGGRNQQLALLIAEKIQHQRNVVFLSAGSDGGDGPGSDAGAIVDGETVLRGAEHAMDAVDYAKRADAGSYLSTTGDLIDTGPTGTNVMDLMLALKVDSTLEIE